MTTELQMKAELDGWFYVYNCTRQEVIKRKVAKNYIPSHKPRMLDDDQKPEMGYPWKPSEDDMLIELRHRDHTWREVGKFFRMSPSAVRNRYLWLCLKRGMQEHKIERDFQVTEQENRIMALRAENKSFNDIAELLNLTRNQVAGIIQRVRRREAYMECAA
jgi:DNA-binding CsgD family transcriptional regulator